MTVLLRWVSSPHGDNDKSVAYSILDSNPISPADTCSSTSRQSTGGDSYTCCVCDGCLTGNRNHTHASGL